MRKLCTSSCALAGAVFASYYLLPLKGCISAAAVFCAAAVLLSFFRSRGDLCRRAFLIAVGASVGFAAYSLHWYGTLRHAEAWDGTEQTLQVRVMEAPAEFDYYTRLHVQRTENPKLDLMLYDYRGSIDPDLEPGRLLSVTAKLRRADLRYGERSDSYVSKDIYLTGTLHEITEQPDRSVTLRTLAALCSRRISKFADAFFSPDTGVFMRSLMLGDKTDFYRDLPLYASMRGAGFMHIVAVSGMHIAFLVGMIQLLFGARPASSVFGILLVWFFVFMTGASPSAVRAGTMQTILLMAPVFRRENDGPTSLAAALALILLMNPFSCASVSLQMSFSAMAGMILLAEPLTDAMLAAFRLNEQSRLRAPVAVIAASLAVLATSAPVTVLHFGTLAVYSPLTNLLGLWAVSLCFCFGYLSCLSGMLFLPLGRLLAFPAEMLARYLMMLARLICRLPHHLVAMHGTEMLLYARMKDLGAVNEGIETAASQMDLALSLGDGYMKEAIRAYLEEPEEMRLQVLELHTLWENGDAEGLTAYIEGVAAAEDEESADAYRRMFVERNRVFADRCLAEIASGRRVLVAVGCGHLYGKDGVIRLLEEAGCEVTPVE